MYCTFDKVRPGRSTPLESHSLVKTVFPQEQAHLTWLPVLLPAQTPVQKKARSGKMKPPTTIPSVHSHGPSPPISTSSKQLPKSETPTSTLPQQSHASLPVHLQPPTVLTCSILLPTTQGSHPTHLIEPPVPASITNSTASPTTSSSPRHLTIRILSTTVDPPQMTQSISAPQETLKRTIYPVLDLETMAPKRQRKR